MTNRKTNTEQQTQKRRKTGLTAYDPKKAYNGYTLFAPLGGDGVVYLIDMKGKVVHKWKLPYAPGLYGYLLENGNLFYNGKIPVDDNRFWGWSQFKGGIILEIDWNGNVIWEYRNPCHHHDARRMRNGNNLVLCIEKIPEDIAKNVKGGLAGSESSSGMWGDKVIEVASNGDIVWEWHAYEHLDLETDKITPQDFRSEWTHGNTVEELPDGDILVSFRNISTVAIIDKKSGNLKYKVGSEVLAQQHDPTFLDNGNILIFDNGTHRQTNPLPFSRVIEINPKTNKIVWEYHDQPVFNFFSPYISGARRLANGNTLITDGVFGRIFEVTSKGDVVWEYISPYFSNPSNSEDSISVLEGSKNSIFRAFRYASNDIPQINKR